MKSAELLAVIILSALVGGLSASLYMEKRIRADIQDLTLAIDNLVGGVNVISEGMIMAEFEVEDDD